MCIYFDTHGFTEQRALLGAQYKRALRSESRKITRWGGTVVSLEVVRTGNGECSKPLRVASTPVFCFIDTLPQST